MTETILLHILYAFMVWTRKTGVAAKSHWFLISIPNEDEHGYDDE